MSGRVDERRVGMDQQQMSRKELERELDGARRVLALLVLHNGGEVHITHKELVGLDRYTLTWKDRLIDDGMILVASRDAGWEGGWTD